MAASDSVSWHRSHGEPPEGFNPFSLDVNDGDSDAYPPPLTPASLRTVQSVDLEKKPSDDVRSKETVGWLCYRCNSSPKTETADGVWMFVPHGASSPDLSPDQAPRAQSMKGPPASPSGSTAGSEFPESESRADDPIALILVR